MLTSSRHDRRKIIAKRKLLGVFFAVAVILLLFRTPAEGLLSSIFMTVIRPAFVAGGHLGDWWERERYIFQSKESLVTENNQLKKILELVSVEAYSRESLRKENDTLKERLGRMDSRDILLARVLASPSNSPYDTLIIDVGSEEGVLRGMQIMSDGDFVLGEVTSVFNKSSVVTLYSSPGYELPVTVGSSSAPALLVGLGGGNFRAALPKGVPIEIGNIVHIPAITPSYAGIIEAVSRPEGSSLQLFFVRWPINITTVPYVYVILAEEKQKK